MISLDKSTMIKRFQCHTSAAQLPWRARFPGKQFQAVLLAAVRQAFSIPSVGGLLAGLSRKKKALRKKALK